MRSTCVTPSKEGSAHTRIPSLDGIRLLAFLAVFVAHAGFRAPVPGEFGVTVFFFLSGFLIMTLVRVEVDRTGTLSLTRFYLRRTLRIFPAALLFLAVATAYTLMFTPLRPESAGVVSQLLYYSNYYLIDHGRQSLPSYTAILWSLAIEEHFYLLLPLVALCLYTHRRRRLFLLGLATLAGAVLLWRIYLVHVCASTGDRIYMATDTRIDSILFGCILAVWRNPTTDAVPRPRRRVKALLLSTSLALLAFTFLCHAAPFRDAFRYTLQGLALLPLFYFAITDARTLIFAPLNTRPVTYLGTLTYGLYLYHALSLDVAARLGLHPFLTAILALSLCIALCAFLSRYFETPIRVWGRRFQRVRPPIVRSVQ